MRSVEQCDQRADKAIKAMVASMVGMAAIPALVNWALVATAMASGVVAIGLCYDVKLTKDEAWKLVKQFFIAAGLTFMMVQGGTKIVAMILSSTGIGHFGAMAIDCTVSGAQGYAIGMGAREYFRRDSLGQAKPTKEELGRIIREAFKSKKAEDKEAEATNA